MGQFRELLSVGRHEHVPRVLSLGDARQLKVGMDLRGDLLQRMDGDVGGSFEKLLLDFLQKKALASDFGKRAIDYFVAGRHHVELLDFNVGVALDQLRQELSALGERKRASARSNYDASFFHFAFDWISESRSDSER